jgi:hypothetical protein
MKCWRIVRSGSKTGSGDLPSPCPVYPQKAGITRAGRFRAISGSHSILVATGEHWLRWSFGQPGQMTVSNKPGHRESAKEAVKPLRREGRADPVNLW